MRKPLRGVRIGESGGNAMDASGAVSVIGFSRSTRPKSARPPERELRGSRLLNTHLNAQEGVSRHMMSVPIIARPKTQVTGSVKIGRVTS